MMVGIEISTSKSGRLWATEYWKTLIDALGMRGAKHDPRLRYADLAPVLVAMVEDRGGRYYPSGRTSMAAQDDSALRLIVVHRVVPGREALVVGRAALPCTEGWPLIAIPFLGTIGNSKYEAQSRLNRAEVESRLGPQLQGAADTGVLGLCFRLSEQRCERDLDNLADGIIPVFNRHCPDVHDICLVKADAVQEQQEVLGVGCGPRALAGASVVSS